MGAEPEHKTQEVELRMPRKTAKFQVNSTN